MAIFAEAKEMCDTILKKLEKFVSENSARMEKASSHKCLTLLLNPLAESLKLCGQDDSSSLPDNCDARVNGVLKGMKAIFKDSSLSTESTKLSTPPTSLVESYIELTLLVDRDFQATGNLAFEKYFTLFMHVKNLLNRAAA